MWNVKSRMRNEKNESGIWNIKIGMWNVKIRMWNTEDGVPTESWMRNVKSWIPDVEGGIRKLNAECEK